MLLIKDYFRKLKNMIENSKPDAIISVIQQAWILDKKNIRKAYSELKNNIVGKIKSIKKNWSTA